MFQTKLAMACSILATLTAIAYFIVSVGMVMMFENGLDNEIPYDYSTSRECRTINEQPHKRLLHFRNEQRAATKLQKQGLDKYV